MWQFENVFSRKQTRILLCFTRGLVFTSVVMASAQEVQRIVQDALKQQSDTLTNNFTKLLEEKIEPLLTELKETKEKLVLLEGKHDSLQLSYEELVEKLNVDHEFTRDRESFLRFQLDTLEQYQRKNSVRLYNIPQEAEESTTNIAVKVATAINVPITERDIDISHRVKGGTSKDQPDAIIVKFMKREDKINFMKNKKLLKDTVDYKAVYAEEDLTQMRKRIVEILRSTGHPKRRVWTTDGKIHVSEPTQRGSDRSLTINNSSDFLKLKWGRDKCEYIGLYNTY